jgi:hypothetical protein
MIHVVLNVNRAFTQQDSESVQDIVQVAACRGNRRGSQKAETIDTGGGNPIWSGVLLVKRMGINH